MAKKIDKNILVITPIKHIPGVYEMLSNKFNLFYYPDFQINDLDEINNKIFYAIYTNPNKSKTRIDSSVSIYFLLKDEHLKASLLTNFLSIRATV